MKAHALGLDALGLDSYKVDPSVAITNTSPSMSSAASSPMFGPGSSSNTYYTDKPTITAVQQQLRKIGITSVIVDGKSKEVLVDGDFGPITEAALFKFTGKHGPPDDETLGKLNLLPGGKPMLSPEAMAALEASLKKLASSNSPEEVKAAANAAYAATLKANSTDEVKQEAAAAKREADAAKTPEQVAAVKNKIEKVVEKAQGKSENWFTKEAFGGLRVWQVMLIGAGTIAVGVGAYKVLTNGNSVRARMMGWR